MGWICEEDCALKFQGRICAEVVRKSMSSKEGYAPKLWGSLWVARKAMRWICEEDCALKFQGRICAEVVRKSMSCEEGYALNLWGRLCAEVPRKDRRRSCEQVYELWGRPYAEIVRKSVRISCNKWSYYFYMQYFIVRNYFKVGKYSLFLLWQHQARKVYCYESLHLLGYSVKAALLRTAIKRNALCA